MSQIETNKPNCIRCGQPMFNAFRKRHWCYDCELAMQDMSFNGLEVLEMVLAIVPPMPPAKPGMAHVVPVAEQQFVAGKVLIEKGIFPHKKDDNEGDGNQKSPLLGVN